MAKFNTNWLNDSTSKPSSGMSTGEKVAVGGLGLALLGGLFAAFGSGKKPAAKPGLGKPQGPGCGPCGR